VLFMANSPSLANPFLYTGRVAQEIPNREVLSREEKGAGAGAGAQHMLAHVGFSWGILGLVPRNLKRYYGRGDQHFLTFSCYRVCRC